MNIENEVFISEGQTHSALKRSTSTRHAILFPCCDRYMHSILNVCICVRERFLALGLSLREHYKIIKRIKVSVRENLQPQYKFEIIHLTLCKELIHKKAVNLSSHTWLQHAWPTIWVCTCTHAGGLSRWPRVVSMGFRIYEYIEVLFAYKETHSFWMVCENILWRLPQMTF